MTLTFSNQYSFTPGYDLYVSYMRLDRSSCAGGDGFVAVGWFRVPPGGSARYNGDVNYTVLDLLRRMPEGRRDVVWRCSGLGEHSPSDFVTETRATVPVVGPARRQQLQHSVPAR
jgi:hypothetical protein